MSFTQDVTAGERHTSATEASTTSPCQGHATRQGCDKAVEGEEEEEGALAERDFPSSVRESVNLNRASECVRRDHVQCSQWPCPHWRGIETKDWREETTSSISYGDRMSRTTTTMKILWHCFQESVRQWGKKCRHLSN